VMEQPVALGPIVDRLGAYEDIGTVEELRGLIWKDHDKKIARVP